LLSAGDHIDAGTLDQLSRIVSRGLILGRGGEIIVVDTRELVSAPRRG
jgi:hypothetical protein